MADPISIPGFTDPFSSLSHLVGAVVFAVLAVPMLRRGRGDTGRMIALSVYVFSCVFLLSMSGTYHLLTRGTVGRMVLERLDHSAIFVLIAGTFTPVHQILFHGYARWVPIVMVWAAAITAITLKAIFFEGFPEWIGLLLYLGLGWVGVGTGAVLWVRYGEAFVRPMVWGGIAYSFGALLDFFRRPTLIAGVIGPHELFHIAVLAGVSLHWWFVWEFASGRTPEMKDEEVREQARRLADVLVHSGAESHPHPHPALALAGPPTDPELARIVAAWPDLPPHFRAAVLALIEAAGKQP